MRRLRLAAGALLVAFAVVTPVATPAEATSRVSAGSLLAALPVTAESHASSYRRAAFGGWSRVRGRCTTRSVVLIAESRVTATKNRNCTVLKGRWRNEYTGKIVTSARNAQIDHRVALAEAWRSGAWRWSPATRVAFGNDSGYPHSLLAVSGRSNSAKSDHDPPEWMPSVGRCAYLTRWVAVKYRWRLSVDRREKAFIAARLRSCPRTATLIARPPRAALVTAPAPPPHTNAPPSAGVAPVSEYDCPASHPIKGNRNSMIYHVPGGQYYAITQPEECFATEASAVAAGYRRSQR